MNVRCVGASSIEAGKMAVRGGLCTFEKESVVRGHHIYSLFGHQSLERNLHWERRTIISMISTLLLC